jgi:hypothetical protein
VVQKVNVEPWRWLASSPASPSITPSTYQPEVVARVHRLFLLSGGVGGDRGCAGAGVEDVVEETNHARRLPAPLGIARRATLLGDARVVHKAVLHVVWRQLVLRGRERGRRVIQGSVKRAVSKCH